MIKIRKMNTNENSIKETPYMNVKMVSQYLHVAESTVYRWVGMNFIPHAKLQARTVFVKEQIDGWVLKNVVDNVESPEFPDFLKN